MADASLTADDRDLLARSRRATLATIAPDGRSRLVPVCFTLIETAAQPRLYVALDSKPKRVSDPRRLARARDIVRDPRVCLMVDRWSEDWAKLAWLRIDGLATLIEPIPRTDEHVAVVAALRARYRQYRSQPLEDAPLLRIEVTGSARWTAEARG